MKTSCAPFLLPYSYDPDGNITSRSNRLNSALSEFYGYDNLNRLTNFITNGVNKAWTLDAVGNWSSEVTNSSTQTRTENLQNEITGISGASTPTYDRDGNTITDQSGHTLVYDAWNRLVAQKSGATTLVSFSYDALGRQVISTVAGVGYSVVMYFDAAGNVIEEDVNGAMAQQYVWNPNGVNSLVERDTTSYRLYAEQDANGNVTSVIYAGSVAERYLYDPYGTVSVYDANWNYRPTGSAYGWVYLFQGGRYEATGFYHFGARDLSPTLGRWVEQDPIGFGGGDANWYGFVGEDPTSYVDPSGLWGVPNWLSNGWNNFTSGAHWTWNAAKALPGAVGETFMSGEAYDSLSGAVTSMPDTMFGTNFHHESRPLYGNWGAYEGGKPVGQAWGAANSIVLTVGGVGATVNGARALGAAAGAMQTAEGLVIAGVAEGSGAAVATAGLGATSAGVGITGILNATRPSSGASRRCAIQDALERGDINPTTPQRAGAARPPRHHLLPQEQRNWFLERGIDVDDYTVSLDEGTHTALHAGAGPGKGGGLWNKTIMESLRRSEGALGRKLTIPEIEQIMFETMETFNISGEPIIPYKAP